MKKIIILISCMLLIGCSFGNSPIKKTEELFKKYQSLDEGVISDLELTTEGGTLSTEKQKEDYMKIMKMQYSDLKYEIVDEVVNGDEATVTVKISVYDLYKVQMDAEDYLSNNQDKFLTNNVYDNSKFIDYKLEEMMNVSDRVEYTIEVDLVKEDDEWVTEAFNRTTLEKIHGTYNYESE